MFARKALIDCRLQRIFNFQVIRTVRDDNRGQIRIPVQLHERRSKTKLKVPRTHLDEVRESNIGIGFSLAAQMENYGKYIENLELDEDGFEMEEDPSLDDVVPKISNLETDVQKRETMNTFSAIKRKYFKPERLPGMLTYAEKQQMIHLHETDPDYWNVDQLAEGFPATPEIVRKILKVKFNAHTVKQILRHDENVRKNWEAFERGKLKFNDELQKIYSSFVGRSRLVTDEKEMEKFLPPPPDFAASIPVQEFGSIIASSEKHRLEAEKRRKQVDVDEEGRFVMAGKQADIIDEEQPSELRRKHHTLDSLRLRIDSRRRKTPLDQIIAAAEPMKQIEQRATNEDEGVQRRIEETKKDEAVQLREEEHHQPDRMSATGVVSRDFNPFMKYKKDRYYPMQIKIPRNLWERNKLYRVKDCFYADDGSFLYRVPGIERFS